MIKRREILKMSDAIDKQFKLDENVRDAIIKVDREAFVPTAFRHLAYNLDALPLKESQWISSPVTVAKMTQHLDMEGVDSVLEIGCGSGYQAAVLSKMCRRVFTIERINELLKTAKKRFSELELHNIFAKFDDGQMGWAEYAPFDRIIFSATASQIPQVIFDQLGDGGTLIAPMQEGDLQILTRYYKRNGRITTETIEQCLFVPVLNGTQR
jgi:protein-L-isoaspartate(D-aspartate) O-methyltransferase